MHLFVLGRRLHAGLLGRIELRGGMHGGRLPPDLRGGLHEDVLWSRMQLTHDPQPANSLYSS